MIFKKKEEEKEGDDQVARLEALKLELKGKRQTSFPPFKSDMTKEMMIYSLQKELDKYDMDMKIDHVALEKTKVAFSGWWMSEISEYRDYVKRKWSVDIGNERFFVEEEAGEKQNDILFDAEQWAKTIILQTGKKLSKKARSMFGGATVINGGEGNIFLKLGYCNRCKTKVPLITRHMIVARNYWDIVPEVCPYCLFKEKGYDIKIRKLPKEKKKC